MPGLFLDKMVAQKLILSHSPAWAQTFCSKWKFGCRFCVPVDILFCCVLTFLAFFLNTIPTEKSQALLQQCCDLPRQPSAELEQQLGNAYEGRGSKIRQQVRATVAGGLPIPDPQQQPFF